MGSSRETFTGKRLEPTRALILGDGGELLRGPAGREKAPVNETPLGEKAWRAQTPPRGHLHPRARAPEPLRCCCLRRRPRAGPALAGGARGSLSRRLAGSGGVCGGRDELSLDSQQQRELPLAKDEKLVSWEEIIFREET